MKVLILGKGWIGLQLYEFLLQHKIDVVIADRKSLDYTNKFFLDCLLNYFSPDVVINCVGYTGNPNVDACEDNKELCWKLNVEFPVLLANTLWQYNQAFQHDKKLETKLIHFSSGCIYQGFLPSEINNGLFDKDSSWYCKTKHAAERLLNNENILQLRIRMPFSEVAHRKNLLTKLIQYDKIIHADERNSLTYLPDLYNFIYNICNKVCPWIFGIHNFVNGYTTHKGIIPKFRNAYHHNPDKKEYIEASTLNLKCQRSNCVILVSETIKKIYAPMPLDTALEYCSNHYDWNKHAELFKSKE